MCDREEHKWLECLKFYLGSPMASAPFWLALICQLVIILGYFWFYRKEQLGKKIVSLSLFFKMVNWLIGALSQHGHSCDLMNIDKGRWTTLLISVPLLDTLDSKTHLTNSKVIMDMDFFFFLTQNWQCCSFFFLVMDMVLN